LCPLTFILPAMFMIWLNILVQTTYEFTQSSPPSLPDNASKSYDVCIYKEYTTFNMMFVYTIQIRIYIYIYIYRNWKNYHIF
jgi:hypothetical protein